MAEDILKKDSDGYGYKYTDLAAIHKHFDEQKIRYYQYIETDPNGNDYIWTVPYFDGVEQPARRGCRVVQNEGGKNAAQDQGSALTYARRYSLLMSFGLATTDDDALAMTQGKATPAEVETILDLCTDLNVNVGKLLSQYLMAKDAGAILIKLKKAQESNNADKGQN